jgi:hypothetical protein
MTPDRAGKLDLVIAGIARYHPNQCPMACQARPGLDGDAAALKNRTRSRC